ncbi:MAG: ThiF family adenylyltransferase, partial [Bifidobacteriaceae bacterium]|nr:ThiF family adenylyltransferase [Bifidobacteriaceae bacterium]
MSATLQEAPRDLFLNPFVPVVTSEDAVLFILDDGAQIAVSGSAHPVVETARQGTPVTVADLVEGFGRTEAIALMRAGVFTESAFDLAGRHSRTEGVFHRAGRLEKYRESVRTAHVLVLGAGAIGSHVAWSLAAAGVGRLTILDHDVIERSNLNRQLLYFPSDVGRLKTEVLAQRLKSLDEELECRRIDRRIASAADALAVIRQAAPDLVVKAIDEPLNVTAWVNAACVQLGVPYVQGGFVNGDGIVGPTYVPGQTPCHGCYAGAEVENAVRT